VITNAKIRDVLLIALLAGFCASCGASHPMKFYALSAPAEAPQAASPQFPTAILVARVTAGHLYRDERLVYRTAGVELGTYEYQRWSEPPVDMIQDSLISALRATNQYRSVDPVASNGSGQYIVRAHLEALDELDQPQLSARFSIHFELYDPKSAQVLWSDSYAHDEPVQGKEVVDVVKALDANVTTGMQQLATNLSNYFASHPPIESH
jgi:ABC-type uncharacterized transport system auxiliary subunit